MTSKIRTFLTLFLLMMGTAMSWASFTDFKMILSDAEGTLITADEISNKSAVEFGFTVAADGTVTRVAKDDAAAVGTVKGTYHSSHGLTNFSMTVKVDGGVKVGMGTCAWGGDVKINGTTAFNTNNGTCWHGNKTANIVYGHYIGEAGTITISGGSYTPYVSVESEAVKSNEISFSLGSVECEGTLLPTAKTVIAGEQFTIPANHTLYKEGSTLTGWTDGTNTYTIGQSFAPTADVALTPVFTQNSKSLSDRTDAVTLKWDFQTKNGAPTMAYQGSGATGVYVTQATIDGQSIDVKLDFDATSGKIANANWTDWCQMNGGTKFTIPSCKGATVSIEAYSAPTTTTIDGLTDYTANGNTISMEIGSKAETIDIVIGNGSYYRYIQTVLPVVSAGKLKEVDLINTDFTDWKAVSSADASTLDVTTNGSKENITFTLHKTTIEPTYTNAKFTYTGAMVAQKNGQSTVTTSAFANITSVTFKHGATGSNRGWGFKVKGDGDADWVTLSSAVAAPASGQDVTIDVNRTNVQLQWYNLADAQNAMMFNLTVKGNVLVVGKEYDVNVASNIAEAGSSTIYPAGGTYVENDEVTLTATENFGYDFVNWTNAAGDVASTDAKFKTTVTANETYTANFKKVNTYELAVDIDGGANEYMISYNPAPTVIDNKKMYEEGTKVTMTAAANRVLTFTNWSNGETAAEMAIMMNEDKKFTASYAAVDFIAGWDFYATGGSSRTPDFYGNADNAADNFGLINAAGDEKGFYLRPYNNSYEGKTCALNWNMLADKWYWQTKVNAAEFKNIKIESVMMYNYNAYSVQKLEASLDGTTWETITTQDLGGTKNWQPVNGTLPAKYDNQAAIWLRWIPDYSSAVKGTSSNNDGTSITNIFVLGDKQIVDDGIAPALVSSVPENNATGASANGKIVLTFSKKVQLTDAAKATLTTNTQHLTPITLSPTVSGKTITYEYKGLDYSSDYTFTLAANSVADLTGNNILKDAVTIAFQTKVKPSIEKALYDAIVSNGDELAAAIKAANSRKDQTTRYRIFVKKGAHVLPTNGGTTTGGDGKTYDDPRTYMTGSNISIIGADYETTSFTNKTPASTWDNGYGSACPLEGIGNGDVLINSGTGNYFQGVMIKTSMGDAHGRDIALQDKGNKTIFKDACLWGYQDTYVSNNGRGKFYFEGGVLRGRTDYLCGKGDVYYNQVTLQQCGGGGYLAVPSQAKKYGYVFESCYIKKETKDVTFYLGRPWGSGTPIACFINTKMDTAPLGNGWADMSGGYPKRFAEYNSTLTNGATLDLSGRRTSWTDKEGVAHANDPILTIDDVQSMSLANVCGQDDDWDPTSLTEQASAPQNVTISNSGTIKWDDNNYVLGWVIFKNGEYVANVTEPSYAADDASATWTVRAANEAGGLGEASVATVATGISVVNATVNTNDAILYNIAGQRITRSAKGIVISNGKKYIVR